MNPAPTPEQINALNTFAAIHGRRWKSKLLQVWQADESNPDPLLRQVRNAFGPSWLKKFKAF